MKDFSKRLFGLLLVMCSLQVLHAQDYAHAGEYMDAMGELYGELNKDQWAYIKASSQGRSARRIERKRQELLQTNREMQQMVRRMPAYEGDASLRDSTVQYLRMCFDVLNEDYGKIVDLEAIAEDSYDAMEAYLTAKEQASDRLDDAGSRLEMHQKIFAASHNVQLIEGEQSRTSLRLEQSGKTIRYYNQLYLVFFKCYKQEAYLLDAAHRGDVSALVQNQQALGAFAAEGMATLDTMPDFEGDASLKQTCREILNFYAQEAEESAPVMIDYFLKKENFETIQKAFEAKRPRDRTQEDVDRFNKAVEDYNNAVADYNTVNEQLNKQRGELVDNWNKASDRFMKEHVK